MKDFLKLIRPHHWTKNIILFAPLIFSNRLLDQGYFLKECLAFLIFCGLSSTIYILNDIFDRERDLKHPRKKLRPIASGKVSVTQAFLYAFVIVSISLGLSGIFFDANFVIVGLFYLAMMIAYTLKLKHIVVLDVFIIALGFVLRAHAGIVALNLPPSSWFLLCTTFLALFLGFSKRRNELVFLQKGATNKPSTYLQKAHDGHRTLHLYRPSQ